jgi:Raf kinase inhibitor-like YbhB/YbcL family protein
MRLVTRVVVVMGLLAASTRFAPAQTPPAPQGPPRTPPLLMTTTAFEDGGVIPNKYTGAATGTPVSPELKWSQVPPGTQSFVLFLHDMEGAVDKGPLDATHWVVWNIPGTSTGLPENLPAGELPDGTRQVGYRANAYLAPGAGPGPYHHYAFELFALDTKLTMAQSQPAQLIDTRIALVKAMEGHVIGKATLVGRFHR